MQDQNQPEVTFKPKEGNEAQSFIDEQSISRNNINQAAQTITKELNLITSINGRDLDWDASSKEIVTGINISVSLVRQAIFLSIDSQKINYGDFKNSVIQNLIKYFDKVTPQVFKNHEAL